MPKARERVKVVFKNGTLVEGLVLEWDNDVGEIYTAAGHVIEIYNIPENVLFVKVLNPMLDRDPELEEFAEEGNTEIISQFVEDEELYTQEQDPRLRAASLAELRIAKSKQLRQIVSKRLRSGHITSNTQDYYESPDFTQSCAVKHPPKKNNHSS